MSAAMAPREAAAPARASGPFEWMVPQRALDNLKYYKYGAVDKSPITKYIMKPYWDWAVTLFPMWMAPNLITLTGFAFVLVNLVCVAYYLPELAGPRPFWLALSFPIGLHLYQTFDNVDGRQARRTGSSSPLGELFDHGCDALNCMVGGLIQAAALDFGFSWRTVAMFAITMVPFYLSTWEEYHTGVLYLGYFNGPTEGILLGQFLMLVAALYGPHIVHTNLGVALNLWGFTRPAFIPKWMSVADVMVVVMLFLAVAVQFVLSAYNVYAARRQRGEAFAPALFQILPMAVLVLATYTWLAAPGSAVFQKHMFVFFVFVGVVFGRLVAKIIYAYVTKTAFPSGTVLLLPLLFGALNANLPTLFGIAPIMPLEHEGQYLLTWAFLAAVHYLVWSSVIIHTFCRQLNIKPFSIPYKAAQAKSA